MSMAANSELVAVEIVRTRCGSIGLDAAVPITTALAAVVVNGHEPDAGSLEVAHEGTVVKGTVAEGTVAERDEAHESKSDWDDFAPRDDVEF